MNPEFLPPLALSLRTLGDFAGNRIGSDSTLGEIADELDRARSLLSAVRGTRRATSCTRHPGGPFDPTVENGCLLCGTAVRRPARPMPDDFVPGDVLRYLTSHGQEAAAARYGAHAVARALAVSRRHPSQAPPDPAPDDTEGERT